jgi:broad specificity phosphatase PhoE
MILLRHGQSEFNLAFTHTRRDPGILDAPLTPLGHAQAERAAEALAGDRPPRRIIVSPYTRALQTAAPIARRTGATVHVTPLVRERFAFSCDVGSPRSELERAWPRHDFTQIDEIWWPPIEEAADSVIGRAALFRAEMAALPDWSDTLVVSHWGFILCVTGTSVANGEWLRCDPTAAAPARVVWRP